MSVPRLIPTETGSAPGSAPGAPVGRADVVRNRARIYAAALELFAEHGTDAVQFEAIAERAGVARATLFRHIGSKQALILEIYADRLVDIHRLCGTALAEPDPWRGFETLFRTMVHWMHEDRGLYDVTYRFMRQDDLRAQARPTVEEMGQVIARAQRDGALWPGLRAEDLLPLLGFAVGAEEARLDAFVDVILRGLRVDTTS